MHATAYRPASHAKRAQEGTIRVSSMLEPCQTFGARPAVSGDAESAEMVGDALPA